MKFTMLHRWSGFAAMAGGVLLILGSLVLMSGYWVADDVALATSILLLVAEFLLVPVLIGIFLYGDPTRGSWLAGFILAVLGVQFDLANFYSPMGTVTLLIGLGLMAAALPADAPKLRLALWGWFGANLIAFISLFSGFRLLLGLAVFLAGGARLLIGSVLLRLEKSDASR